MRVPLQNRTAVLSRELFGVSSGDGSVPVISPPFLRVPGLKAGNDRQCFIEGISFPPPEVLDPS